MNLKRLFQLVIILCNMICLVSCSEKLPKLSPLGNDATILAFGDSLTYGTGVNSDTQSYPAILSKLTGLSVVNKGIPGEVSQQGLARLTQVLQQTQPDLVILCHGGNDIIRKLDREQLKNNLSQMITLIQSTGAELVLIGVPNFSLMLNVPDFYSELAAKYTIPIDLEILPKLESSPKLKSDQIHPNAEGYNLMAQSIYSLLKKTGAL